MIAERPISSMSQDRAMSTMMAEMHSQLKALRIAAVSPADAYILSQSWRWCSDSLQTTAGNRSSVRYYASHVDRIHRAHVR
jgi:hypothetical protein